MAINQADAERLVHTYSDLILRLSYTWLKSTYDAEDICQTVFLKILTGAYSFDSPAHEKAWVIRTAINACKDELKAFRRRSVGLESITEAAAPQIPEDEVLDVVMRLPQKYREVIYLYYYEGYSIRETASFLNRSESAVTAQLDRGRKKLRGLLGGDYCEQKG